MAWIQSQIIDISTKFAPNPTSKSFKILLFTTSRTNNKVSPHKQKKRKRQPKHLRALDMKGGGRDSISITINIPEIPCAMDEVANQKVYKN
uniref:Uncharacterized protein n=1 Tax=Strongyloides venezuelensis TaxID=75913 RepID=A0A0K0G5U4_STRVS